MPWRKEDFLPGDIPMTMSQGTQREQEKEVAILRVILRGVVGERLWEGKALPNEPTKRRKMVGVWALGLAN